MGLHWEWPRCCARCEWRDDCHVHQRPDRAARIPGRRGPAHVRTQCCEPATCGWNRGRSEYRRVRTHEPRIDRRRRRDDLCEHDRSGHSQLGSSQRRADAGRRMVLESQLPPGFIGDLHGFAECTRGQLLAEECPSASMVGTLRGSAPGFQSAQKQVFNMVPAPGQPAELGFEYSNVPVFIKFTVRTGGDYGFVAHVIVPARIIYQTILTLWGVPAEKSHNRWRAKEGGCSKADMTNRELVGADEVDYCIPLQGPVIAPVLTLPTSCGAPQPFALREV